MKIAFVPVRCGSKSIPFKNIKLFCGKPLLYWSVIALENSNNIDKIIIATDCEKIKEEVIKLNFNKVEIFDRSIENATDTSSTESVLLEYINSVNLSENDFLVLVQVTSPFLQSNDIDNAFDLIKSTSGDSLLSCVRVKRFFWNDDGNSLNYDPMSRPRRQDFKGTLMENGAFYINTVKGIKTTKNRLSGKIVIYEMPQNTSVEIDEPSDWNEAENLFYRHFLAKKNNFNKIKLFMSDVDGTLTDAGMYYDQNGSELKRFNTHDGKAFELLRQNGIKTGIITSENTEIVSKRAKKLSVDFLIQGASNIGKLNAIIDLCQKENLKLENVAYIGDDINCKELLESVGVSACPSNAIEDIKKIPQIIQLNKSGGNGAVREFVTIILNGIS
jgi:YrbI family 3-deoxy-D-manno-octulosonate 8-phosphate phosphatase